MTQRVCFEMIFSKHTLFIFICISLKKSTSPVPLLSKANIQIFSTFTLFKKYIIPCVNFTNKGNMKNEECGNMYKNHERKLIWLAFGVAAIMLVSIVRRIIVG